MSLCRSATRTFGAALSVGLMTFAPSTANAEGEGYFWEDFSHGYCTSAGCLHGKLEYAGYLGTMADAYDESTGRDLRHFPPDRVVDYKHMKLQMYFEDLNDRSFTATETLTVVPEGDGADSLKLNALRLDVRDVRLDGRPVEHFHDDEILTLRFSPPLEAGTEYDIVFEYACTHPTDGMFFTPSSDSAPDYTAEVHTQGQTESNRNWFIAHDFPNEQMTTELIVNVPDRFAVSANGRLMSNLANDGRAIWHYLQDKPHVSYLVSLVIGEFDIVDLPHDSVPMKVWVPKGLAHQVMPTYGNTAPMIDLFERRLGVAYPYDRYDQLVVKNFGAGGMENTTVTSMYPSAIFDDTELKENDLDGLIAHELAHQWTGDMITCKSWAHIWLNEGWATYGSALWFEERDGEDGYLDSMRRSFGVARRDVTTNELPMVSPVYGDSWEVFRRRANPYPKGSSILHMLRCKLGEDVFWDGVHLYMNRHKFGVAETNDFRYAMEEVSGMGLEWYFEQWCFRPGTPALDIDVDYDGASRELIVTIDQTQHIDRRTPAFRFDLPIHVRTSAGDEVHTVNVTEMNTVFRATLTSAPSMVQVDPYLHVLKTVDVTKPRAFWMTEARDGVTIVARHDAVRALRAWDMPETIALTSSIAADPNGRHTLRQTAVATLGSYGSDDARDELLKVYDEGIADPRVRASVISEFGSYDLEDVADRLVNVLKNDEGYDPRNNAINVLAKLEAEDHVDLIAATAHVPSQHDQIRDTALSALATMEDERGVDLAMQYAAWGHQDRPRARAISALGDLAEHDEERIVDFLLELLDDPHTRPRRAAGSALAKIGNERALEPLQAIATSHRDKRERDRAEGWVETLKKNMKDDDDDSEDS
ncbi:MAG: M1 family aminopeptidase [Planctomycetota bacterium]